MNIHSHARRESRYLGVASRVFQGKRRHSSVLQLEDNRPEAIAQRRIRENINSSNRVQQMTSIVAGINASSRVKQFKTIDKNVNHYVTKQSTPGVAQFLKSHATKYIKEYNAEADKFNATEKDPAKQMLRMEIESAEVTKKEVESIIENPKYSVAARRELLKRWNHGKQPHFISTPGDLKPTSTTVVSTDSFQDWDSDKEDGLDLDKLPKSEVMIFRGSDKKAKDKKGKSIPKYPFSTAVKVGRQIVKRNLYTTHLPMATELGGTHIEFDSPYGNNIFAFPLASESDGKDNPGFHREGGTGDHTWKGIGTSLSRECMDENKGGDEPTIRSAKRKRLESAFGCFMGGEQKGITPGIAIAASAIGCDLMKGSAGYHFIDEARKKVGTCAESDLMKSFFYDEHPLYEPAAPGGRSLVSDLTRKRKISAALKASISSNASGANNTTTTTTAPAPPIVPQIIPATPPSDTSLKPVAIPMNTSGSSGTSSLPDTTPKKEEEPKKT